MSTDALAIESVLVAEFGRTRTQAYLVDLVDGAYRFLARGEGLVINDLAAGDVTIGFQQAVQTIERVSGRTLLRRESLVLPQGANGDGVDSFVVVANLTDPLRLAVLDAGAGPDEITVVADVTRGMDMLVYTVLPPARNVKPQEWALQQAAVFSAWRPDIILLLGGASTGAEGLQRMIGVMRTALMSGDERLPDGDPEARPPVIWVAAPDAVQHAAIEQIPVKARCLRWDGRGPADLRAVLEAELSQFVIERLADEAPGFELVTAWTQAPVVSRQSGSREALRYLAQERQQRVVYLDVEDAVGVQVASANRLVSSLIADADLGLCLPNLLGMVEGADVARWLPFDMDEEALLHWALNRALRAGAIALTSESQYVEQAFAREAARIACDRLESGLATRCDLLIGSQRMTAWQPAASVSALLDGVQPAPETGIVHLVLDHQGLLATLGALACSEPEVALEVMTRDALASLGTCLVLEGGGDGQRVARGRIRRASGETDEFEVVGGRLAVMPLGADEIADVEFTLENRARFGAHKAGQTVRLKTPAQARGGSVGLVFDARGRPLALSGDPRRQAERARTWLASLGLRAPDEASET